MGIWNKFNRLAKLDFDYEGVLPGTIPQIYANYRNQVEIVISVQVDGIDNLKEHDLKDLIYFCNYTTGKKLDSLWRISDKKNDYTKTLSPSWSRVRRDVHSEALIPSITYVYRYLSCSESIIDKNFSVGISIPGIGDFDTSKNGTSTPNGAKGRSGSAFKSPKFLSISTLHPINYSNIENIYIMERRKFADMFCIASDMLVVHNSRRDQNGKSLYLWIKIKTANGFHFKNKNIIRNRVVIPDVHIVGDDNTADIVCGARRREDYDFTLIFIDAKTSGVAAGSEFRLIKRGTTGDTISFIIGDDDNRNALTPYNSSIPEIDSEYISLVICNYTITKIGWSANDCGKIWNNAPSEGVTIMQVFDEYGNSGHIRIKLDFNDADYPKVTINDQLDFFN